jgi:hypothetical protein
MADVACAKCGSAKVLGEGGLGAGQEVTLVFFKRKSRLFPGAVRLTLRAQVCVDCGYVEVYAQAPGELLKAFPFPGEGA